MYLGLPLIETEDLNPWENYVPTGKQQGAEALIFPVYI